ncbi:hypothetical protein IFM89_027096 [Coptis chinensis]|uniref:Uncharacterized protein n=1 Tax=Coptis chinensis TaxID=261450 RepID=A0A835HK50_9MAGN|nr:hypothetical protein IFM89_027096 [Coptis chinensis]
MGSSSGSCDYSFKILLIGDSGVGKSSLLVTFISNSVQHLSPTIGVDFKIKQLIVGGKRLKLTIWDTGHVSFEDFVNLSSLKPFGREEGRAMVDGEENTYCWTGEVRTVTSSYYRAAQGIILVYDVTRRESFTNLADVWAKEVELYSTNQDCIKMLVGNKVDRVCSLIPTFYP